ncbi:MAG: DUF402 domain-containing protein [Clostridia bacterium]|nr:DUF402 domain-containing protein [Clostridia bacterium]
MKKKYADFPTLDKAYKKFYENKYVENVDFKGNISVLTAVKYENNKKNDFLRWIQFYSDDNKNIAMTVGLNEKNKILYWYFDVAKNTLFTDQGVPYIEDLYLDVIIEPDGKKILVDEDELQEALLNNDITKEEFDFAYRVANGLMDQIEGKEEELKRFTKKYINLFWEGE